jgi:DNA adenine methylase
MKMTISNCAMNFYVLLKMDVFVILTNSNTQFTRELYNDFNYVAVDAKRSISSNPNTRSGEDIIVFETKPRRKTISQLQAQKSGLLENFPATRFMGSKYRILPFLWEKIKEQNFNTVLDAFSGSGCVSYMLKQKGKQVISNDFLHFAYAITKATIENSKESLNQRDLELLMQENSMSSSFISDTFKGLYFSDDENRFLDNFRANVEFLDNEYKKALAFASISRACLKRRPRGIFAYTGFRYDDGRRDLTLTLQEHFIENVEAFNDAVFDNGQRNLAYNSDIFDLDVEADLVYLDPPYYSTKSDNDYTRRYHFVEGLVRNWEGVDIMWKTKTKKFKRYETPFLHKNTIEDAFYSLFEKFRKSIIVLSYSSNSLPEKSLLVDMLKEFKSYVWVYQIEHRYSFGTHSHKVGKNANKVQEFIFIAY